MNHGFFPEANNLTIKDFFVIRTLKLSKPYIYIYQERDEKDEKIAGEWT